MRLYPPHILKVYVDNRLSEGMTTSQVAARLRQELRWDELDPAKMHEMKRDCYWRVDEYLKELERTKSSK